MTEYNNNDSNSLNGGQMQQTSPRGNTKNTLEKMNVMNFIKQHKDKDREKSSDTRFLAKGSESSEFQKVINRQRSKKNIQGYDHNGPQNHGQNFGNNEFMQNKNYFTKNAAFNAHNHAGEYEYEIDLPQNKALQNIGESIGSNPNSVAGHYNDNNQGS